jgi:hypothetical protein
MNADHPTLPIGPPPEEAMDFRFLREAGIGLLERLAGPDWTDFNAHDPGITILEQVCYALSDLGYRLEHPIPDLLCEGGGTPDRGLSPPSEALACDPVTLTDLRRLVLDIPGVANCWLEPVESPEPALHYDGDRRTLSTLERSPQTERVSLKGLWRVLIACDQCDYGVVGATARRLFAHRPLCQDFVEIEVLGTEEIVLRVDIEIGPVADPETLLLEILSRAADYVTPHPPFRDLHGLLADGRALEDIFEGPGLTRGFLDEKDLPGPTRREALRTSDLIRLFMDLPGVRAVRGIALAYVTALTGGKNEADAWSDWSLELDPARTQRLAIRPDLIRLWRDRMPVQIDNPAIVERYSAQRTARAGAPEATRVLEPEPPQGRDRRIADYRSILHQFPEIYGVGPAGLPESASLVRQGRMKQLKAYLLMMDQLLADSFAQTGNAASLLSADAADTETYAVGRILPDGLNLNSLRIHGDEDSHRSAVAEAAALSRDAKGDAAIRRRQLDHLLARVGEAFVGHLPSGAAEPGDGIAERLALLARLPRIAASRGTAENSLAAAGPENRAGLAERIALKLGFRVEDGETFEVVEHCLLRPLSGDEEQTGPLLSEAVSADPYSLQLSLVFPGERGRFAEPGGDQAPGALGFRALVEHLVRLETPAHLTPYVHWLAEADYVAFEARHRDWHTRRRAGLLERFPHTGMED